MAQVVVENLVKTFGQSNAVDGVSFVAREGEILTLLGPSGCGKSTILRCIAGLEHPDSGRIVIGSEPVFDPENRVHVPSEHRNIGMVFQSYAIWPHLSVFDNVAFPLRLRRTRAAEVKEAVRAVLKSVGMLGYEERYPWQLSGGQQQRVVLARCLVYHPRVLLLDEPLANLDAKLREEMRAELREVQRQFGLTTIYVTHDQSEAMALSDHIVVLREGRILRQGAPRSIFSDPEHPFVATFLGCSNLFDGTVTSSRAGETAVDVPGWGSVVSAGEGVPDRQVALAIRPTDLLLSRERPDSETNLWETTIDQVVYLGETTDCTLRVGEVRLNVRTGSDQDWKPGDQGYVSLAPSKVRLMGEGSQA